MMKSPPANLLTTPLVHSEVPQQTKKMHIAPITRITSRVSSRFLQYIWCISTDIFPRNVESLKRRFTEMSETGSKASYTILLVGGGGVGKSLFVEFIANVLQWKDINDYDLDVLNPANEQDGSGNQSQTNPVHLYEFTSKSGIVVSASIFNVVCRHNLF